MAICPFMTKDPHSTELSDWAGCIISCALRIGENCSIRVLAEKAIFDAKQIRAKQDSEQEKS